MYHATVIEDESEYSFVILIATVFVVGTKMFVKTCTGVAITKLAILSAAHCVTNGNYVLAEPESVNLRWTSNKTYLTNVTKSLHIHPDYEPINNFNDIAVLLSKLKLDATSPVRGDFDENRACRVYGFGKYVSDDAVIPIILQMLQVALSDSQACESVSNSTTVICVSTTSDQGICEGDSGGPLICDGAVVGTLSRGIVWGSGACGTENLGGLNFFEHLAAHRDFIYNYTGLEIKSGTNISQAIKRLIFACTILIKYLNLKQ